MCYNKNMKSKNICKFIDSIEKEQLSASNFIYEQSAPYSGKVQNSKLHIMYLVSGGTGVFRSGGKSHRLHTGVLFFSFEGQPFCIEDTEELKYYYISFQGGRAEELFRRFGLTPANAVFGGNEGLIPFWKDSIARANEDNIDLLSESVLLYSFSKLKKADRQHDIVSFVLDYLEENFTDPSLSLHTVAEAAGYNTKYLSHLFKKEFGMGFTEYLRGLRIKNAVMLMENGVTSVKNVAALSGFSDPLYFSRVFTEAVGISPKNYKK